jgi:hypothetical protein
LGLFGIRAIKARHVAVLGLTSLALRIISSGGKNRFTVFISRTKTTLFFYR